MRRALGGPTGRPRGDKISGAPNGADWARSGEVSATGGGGPAAINLCASAADSASPIAVRVSKEKKAERFR